VKSYKEEVVMVKSVLLMKLTEQGAKNIKEAPRRIEQALKAVEQMGGKLLGFYVITGEYDYVAIGEMPSDEAALTFVLELTAQGNVKVTTCKAYTQQEFAAVVQKLP
jgi:uncharacterized protein with GYD domain